MFMWFFLLRRVLEAVMNDERDASTLCHAMKVIQKT
jgi:hypothetical protein